MFGSRQPIYAPGLFESATINAFRYWGCALRTERPTSRQVLGGIDIIVDAVDITLWTN